MRSMYGTVVLVTLLMLAQAAIAQEPAPKLECEGLALMETGFGQVEYEGHPVTRQLKLINSGDGPLTITDVVITGEGQAAFTWGITLAGNKAVKITKKDKESRERKDLGWYVVIPASSSIALSVQFDPSAPDEWKFEGARLIINHDDPAWDDEPGMDGNQISLNLTGYTVPVEVSYFSVE